MKVIRTRIAGTSCVLPFPRKTVLALAIGVGLLTACGSSNDDNSSATRAPQVNQLNALTGATKDLSVELREGTNWRLRPHPTASVLRSQRRVRSGSFQQRAVLPRASPTGISSRPLRSGLPMAMPSPFRTTRQKATTTSGLWLRTAATRRKSPRVHTMTVNRHGCPTEADSYFLRIAATMANTRSGGSLSTARA
jgi:hypothetical protein